MSCGQHRFLFSRLLNQISLECTLWSTRAKELLAMYAPGLCVRLIQVI
jgi:hypothetical protein